MPIHFFCLLIFLVFSQSNADGGFPAHLEHGVVIENIAKNSEAEKAGLQAGDTLLSWTRGDAKGQIETPFDLAEIEIEQSPRGNVTLEGLRGTERRSWTIGPDVWGLEAHPNFQGKLLDIYQEGQQLFAAGKFNEAAARWRGGAEEAQRTGIGSVGPWLMLRAAQMLAGQRQHKEADDIYQQAIQKAQGANLRAVAQLFRAWAESFQNRSDWANAEKYYQRAVNEGGKSGNENLMVAQNLFELGLVEYKKANLEKAEEYFHQALDLRQRLAPGSLGVAASLGGLGNTVLRRGDLAKAEEYQRQALVIRQKLTPGSMAVAGSFNNLGNVAKDRGDVAGAEDYYLQALAIKQKLAPDTLDVALSLNNLGNVVSDRGDLAKAEEYYVQALAIRQKVTPGSLDVAATLSNLGVIDMQRGNLAKAEEQFTQALDIMQKLSPGSLDVSGIFNNLGEVASDRGDLGRAEEYWVQALAIRQRVAPGSLDVAVTLTNLGDLAGEQRHLIKAATYFRQALKIFQRLAPDGLYVAVSLNNLGDTARLRADPAGAATYYAQALSIAGKLSPRGAEMATSLQGLGELARERHDPVKAEQYFRQAVAIREKLAPGNAEHTESLAALASVLLVQQQLDAAASLFAQVLNAVENQTNHLGGSQDIRSEFRAKYSDYYRDYIDLLMLQKRPEEAFHVAERWKARSLLDTLSAAGVDIHHGADSELLQRERSLQASMNAKRDFRVLLLTGKHTAEQVEAVDNEVQELRAEYDQVENRIRVSSPAYAALIQPQPLAVHEIQRLLDDDILLLEYSLGKKRSYVWALTSTAFAAHELPGRAVIESAARRLYYQVSSTRSNTADVAGVAKSRRNQLNVTASVLSRMLLRPLADQLPGKQLVIIPDSALQYTPFAFLAQPGKSGAVPLILEHEITYAPSASVVAELRRQAAGRKQAPKAVAVLADPVFDRTDSRLASVLHNRSRHAPMQETLDPHPSTRLMRSVADLGLRHLSRLPYSRREADAIMAVTPVGQGFEAVGFDASRSTATSPELAQYRVVHFATHALSDNHHPELSGLVLSLINKEGMPQNGFLDLRDIYNLNLPADLVVLSGCETALGEEIQGEGIIGLTRGFMYAGATRVVASLWNVDDASTKMLMERFCRAMEQEGMRPAAALRSAQIALWKQSTWKDPFYWAAFQVQGEWR